MYPSGLSFLSYPGGTECGAAGLYPAGLSFLSYTQEALNEQQGFPAGLSFLSYPGGTECSAAGLPYWPFLHELPRGHLDVRRSFLSYTQKTPNAAQRGYTLLAFPS